MNEEQYVEGDDFEMEQPREAKSAAKRRGNKGGVVALVIAIIVVIGLGVFFSQRNNSPVAMVNGEEISRSAYQERVRALENEWQFYFEQGAQQVPARDSEAQAWIKNTAMSGLVDEAIMQGAVRTAGINVSEAEVEEIIDGYRAAYESEADYEEDLRNIGMTEDEFRESLEFELAVRAYVKSVVPAESLTVSEQEVEESFEANREILGEDMTLEQFSEEYGAGLEAEKIQIALVSILEDLRSQANIEYFIDLPELPNPVATPENILPTDESIEVEDDSSESESATEEVQAEEEVE